TLGGCPTGEAKLSPGFNLPAKFIIHTVGPVWQGGAFHEKTLLTSCYLRSLELAQQNHCKTVAFPLISAGAYGYPYDDALQIAYDTCQRFLNETKADMEIYIVLYQRRRNYSANIRRQVDYSGFPDADAFQSVASYISEHYHFDAEEAKQEKQAEEISAEESLTLHDAKACMSYDLLDFEDSEPPVTRKPAAKKVKKSASEDAVKKKISFSKAISEERTAPEPDKAKEAAMGRASAMESAPSAAGGKRSASSMLRHWLEEDYQPAAKLPKPGDFSVEETFTQRLLRFMKEKNMDSPEVYTEACIDRKHFSKILSNIHYQPNKNTAVRLALALKLSPEETDAFLNAAGFALSRSKITDLVISYCISHNQRTVWQVNGILEDYGLASI
ncbi:MAG: macro domain-containing protein, partial [Acidaminococcaceae bacterium]|nr:macro domain-containing protein [Acidaminococcaceae bacterium]